MAYTVEYLRDGKPVETASITDPLKKAIAVAESGMVRHQADSARIVDDDTKQEVWTSDA